jgi:hypothetical protein
MNIKASILLILSPLTLVACGGADFDAADDDQEQVAESASALCLNNSPVPDVTMVSGLPDVMVSSPDASYFPRFWTVEALDLVDNMAMAQVFPTDQPSQAQDCVNTQAVMKIYRWNDQAQCYDSSDFHAATGVWHQSSGWCSVTPAEPIYYAPGTRVKVSGMVYEFSGGQRIGRRVTAGVNWWF